MVTIYDINKINSIYSLPKSIHVNKDVLLDFRLFDALVNPDSDRDYVYDFDVYLPSYGINLQRDYVWEHCQQNEFILTILLDKPIEHVVVVQNNKYERSERSTTVNQVIDGKQRLITIQKFGRNEFPVTIGGEEVYFRDFDEDLKLKFIRNVGYIIGIVYEDTPVTDDMKIKLFNYYNFAGTPQTEEHKNKLQSLLK